MMKAQPAGSPDAYAWGSPWGTYSRFWDSHHYPCQQPPWGTLSAVDLNTGTIAWQSTLGVVDALAAKGIPKTGIYNLGGSIATDGGLVFIGATSDHRLRAFDSKTGKELWVTKLESNGHATPLTYLGGRSKNQYVVIAVGPGGNFGDGRLRSDGAGGIHPVSKRPIQSRGNKITNRIEGDADQQRRRWQRTAGYSSAARCTEAADRVQPQTPRRDGGNEMRRLPPAIRGWQANANSECCHVYDMSPDRDDSES